MLGMSYGWWVQKHNRHHGNPNDFDLDPDIKVGFFFQAEDGIRDLIVTGVQTCALPILWIVADKGREWPGYPLVAIVVQKELWDSGGLRSIKDLKGKRIGVTQIGSTFHYHIGNILEKDGLTLADVKIVPLQAMPATMEALKGKQVDAILVPQPFPGAAEAQGFGKIMAWAGDLYPWQIATIFYSGKFATDRARAVAFMKGYVKASRHYHDAALVQKDGRLVPGAGYEDVVQITAKYTGARPENIKLGFPFQDRNGRLLVTDIE